MLVVEVDINGNAPDQLSMQTAIPNSGTIGDALGTVLVSVASSRLPIYISTGRLPEGD